MGFLNKAIMPGWSKSNRSNLSAIITKSRKNVRYLIDPREGEGCLYIPHLLTELDNCLRTDLSRVQKQDTALAFTLAR